MVAEAHYLVIGNYLTFIALETLKLVLPFALRRAITLRPFFELMRERKPCLLTLFLLDGWYVLFISSYALSFS
jgi:hypothetical protein